MFKKLTGSKSKASKIRVDIPGDTDAPEGTSNLGKTTHNQLPPTCHPQTSPVDIMRRYESTLNLLACETSSKCSCWILQPAPNYPNSPPKTDQELVGGETEYEVRICKSADNIYRLVATHKDNEEVFLNITLNHAKYLIKSDTWHEVVSSQTGRQRLVILNFKDSKRGSFQKFYDELLDILHKQKHLSQVEVFYPPGYDYTAITPSIGCPSVFTFEAEHDMEAMSTAEVSKLLSELSENLEKGNTEAAMGISATLARQKVKVRFELLHPAPQDLAEPEISVKVYVEDKESAGACISMKVRASETVGALKKRVQEKYNFPEAVQKWVIGRRLPKDDVMLKQCGITGPGCSMFLYLVSSRSVGLARDEFLKQQTLQLQGASGLPSQATDEPNIYMSMDHMIRSPGAASSPGGPASRSMGAGGSTSQGQVPSRQQILQKAPPVPARPPPDRSVPVGSMNTEPDRSRPRLPGTSTRTLETGDAIRVMLTAPMLENLDTAQPTTTTPPTGIGRLSLPSQESAQTDNVVGWQCPECTYINTPTRPGCEMCAASRPEGYKIPEGFHIPDEEQERLAREHQLDRQVREAQRRQEQLERESRNHNYEQLIAADNEDLIENMEEFNCPICFDQIAPEEGIILRECLHSFCRVCLASAIRYTEEAALKCPFQDDEFSCPAMLQEREIRALVPVDVYERYLLRSLTTAENQAANSYHCKTADCRGWCIYEDLLNFFDCPVCGRQNCLTCKAIHEHMDCREYQEDLRIRANNDEAAKQTHTVIQKLLKDGEAMHCPQCQVIVQKKDGCDWIRCSICKLEICWVTKGPRWGPMGEGDITGGCRCKIDGEKCHPSCVNCH